MADVEVLCTPAGAKVAMKWAAKLCSPMPTPVNQHCLQLTPLQAQHVIHKPCQPLDNICKHSKAHAHVHGCIVHAHVQEQSMNNEASTTSYASSSTAARAPVKCTHLLYKGLQCTVAHKTHLPAEQG